MKSSIIVALILVASLKFAKGLQIQCRFGYNSNACYTCYGTVVMTGDPIKIERISGYNLAGKKNADVKCFDISGQSGFDDLPNGLDKYFKNLVYIYAQGTDVTDVTEESRKGLDKLEEIFIDPKEDSNESTDTDESKEDSNESTTTTEEPETDTPTTTVIPSRPDDLGDNCPNNIVQRIIAFIASLRKCTTNSSSDIPSSVAGDCPKDAIQKIIDYVNFIRGCH